MSTFTIRVTSSAVNTAGTGYGQQADAGAPSYFDMHVTDSMDALIADGVYDAYCLDLLTGIYFSPTPYSAEKYAGNTPSSYDPISLNSLTQTQVNQLNWLLAQNFTSDPEFKGQYSYGEIQKTIWKIVGFTDAEITAHSDPRLLNDNNRTTVDASDISFLFLAAQTAVASGNNVLPTDAFFTTVVDPVGNAQLLIVQLQSAKIGNYVWLDANADGIQNNGEVGLSDVIISKV
ncbi:hypothetical protein [Chromatium okenii]|uniref:SdrD B-like domain-containing protein n=1 Tax=Chromatium okenii TaxID=61644 RepID=UPI0026F097CB|nr:hypothetical protein [Chromatium okenii]MBV5310737.1 hypothetical protein [Chromatium okenii]